MKISVIIPTYNRAKQLERAIQSVCCQSLTDWELIIVDDGSTDNTKAVADSFVSKDNRIKYLYCPHSGGPSRPINEGIKISKGDYIAILEHDDEWMPEKLEQQISLLEKRNDLAMVGCEVFVQNDISVKRKKITFHKDKNSEQWFKSMMEDKDFFFNLSTLLIRKSHFGPDIFFDEKLSLSADRDFYIRMMPRGFDIVRKPLVVYHSHIGSLSKSTDSNKRIVNDTLLVLQKHSHVFQDFPRAQALLLGYAGILLYSDGEKKQARKLLKSSIKTYPFIWKLYGKMVILVLFGSGFYFRARNYYFNNVKMR